MLNLDSSVEQIPSVGKGTAFLLSKKGIFTVRDLLFQTIHRYEDLSTVTKIADLQVDQKQSILVKLENIAVVKSKFGKAMLKIQLQDDTGKIEITFFNASYLYNQVKVGNSYLVNGKVSIFAGKRTMSNPNLTLTEDNTQPNAKLTAVYSLTEGLSNKIMNNIISKAILNLETIPALLKDDLRPSLHSLHSPKDEFEAFKINQFFAKEFFTRRHLSSLILEEKRQNSSTQKAKQLQNIDVSEIFPFTLTASQEKCIAEIFADFQSGKPMNRLLMGDVGSGKTAIAQAAMISALKSGYQSILLAPTDVLATQHFQSFKEILSEEVEVGLITGNKKLNTEAKLLIGTHALLYEEAKFNNVAVMIVDEQHRFGVAQRAKLLKKAEEGVHVLSMSATPIPRTLALAIYGKISLSTIETLPSGRLPTKTFVLGVNKKIDMYNWIKKEIQEKNTQVFVVCPLISESEVMDFENVENVTKNLKAFFSEQVVESLHGGMKAKEKQAIFDRFNTGEIQILVSTTVIEVGINVPNANIMIIEDADRYGLAQLHQLRGRVGRGGDQGYCFLISKFPTSARLKLMEKENSGFKLAEADLKLRGKGDIFGTKQHGNFEIPFENFVTEEILSESEKLAQEIFKNSPSKREIVEAEIMEKVSLN